MASVTAATNIASIRDFFMFMRVSKKMQPVWRVQAAVNYSLAEPINDDGDEDRASDQT